MNTKPKIVGYGLCGPNEPYLEQTLKEFERLCDETIILLNNTGEKERELIAKYGFHTVEDNREWGVLQWKIKEDFVKNHVAKLNPDMCICMDMDEVFDKNLTREKVRGLYSRPFEAFYFFIVNLWDDGYNESRNFWNIRAWKWLPELGLDFPRKNVHCGLGPEWVWSRGYYAPYLLKHYGLMDKERRDKKVKRYDKYDPKAKFISREYYDSLANKALVKPFDEDKLHQEVVDYVTTTNQQYYKRNMKKQEEIIYIRTPRGEVAPVPKKKLNDYLVQGCTVEMEHNDVASEIDEILAEPIAEPIEESPVLSEDDVIIDAVITSEAVPEPTETFFCDQCDYSADNKRKLNGHKMGKHKA